MGFLNHGFVKVGDWSIDDSLKSGIRYFLNQFQQERAIYAHVVDNVPMYIGICDSSSTTLKSRMDRYQSMTADGTNKRTAELVQKTLKEGKEVGIYALIPESVVHFHGLTIDLVKGLENPLIQQQKPAWDIKS